MPPFKPVLAERPAPQNLQPVPGKVPAQRKWCFSFRYWRQQQYFGLDKTDAQWLTSLLDRLRLLSDEEVERFVRTPEMRKALRYHDINWNQPNIPVCLDDLDWVPACYRNNAKEYALVQFQISLALGRVIGFWDERLVFNIVFLDPLHNMQPTKGYDYRLDDCGPLGCDYTKLLHNIEKVVDGCCKQNGCGCEEGIAGIKTRKDWLEALNVVVLKVPDDDMNYVQELRANGCPVTLYDLFKCGLEAKVLELLEERPVDDNTSAKA